MVKAVHSSPDAAQAQVDIDFGAVLAALAKPIFLLDDACRFAYANLAAEQFLGASTAALTGKPLHGFVPSDSPLHSLIRQVQKNQHGVSQFDVMLESPRIGSHLVSVEVAPLPEKPGFVVIALEERSIARRMEHQLVHRNAARSVTAMAALLAHEVKNPLSGIRGAAQLLEQSVEPDDRALTRLICEETDRIVGLVDRMEMFSDKRPIKRQPVNIHEVLGHVRRIVEHGVGRGIHFVEDYDPSLPAVLGNRELLIQVILNLVKNAAEALVDTPHPELTLSTRYQQGIRLAVPGRESRVDLPLVVGIQDNGPGVPEALRAQLFDPFVSSKSKGKGLGLALVAKIVDDHGGVIEFESEPRRTVFHLMLPKAE